MSEKLTLTTSDGLSLEAELDQPEDPRAALVFCHPHPQMGGTMNAPLLKAIRDHLVERGWAVLRFNFRGIGDSEGETGIGHEELKDARAAIAEAHRRFPSLPIAVAGWSFGGAVAVRVAAERDDLVACLAIAPAVHEKPGVTAGLPEPSELSLKMPTHFIVGINDDLVDPDDCEEWAQTAGVSCEVMQGANHFFWAKYEPLAEEVTRFLESVVKQSEQGTGAT
jgi:alpha/beta superfamily hydrolase